jgi:hypothetical protein
MSLSVLGRFCTLAVSIVVLGSCTKHEVEKSAAELAKDSPVLVVEQRGYQFSMYPAYEDETKSVLKLDIRNKKDEFVKGAKASASLKAQDGHEQEVEFKEDRALQRYVAGVPLKHHEDYVIKARVALDNGGHVYTPRFVFHCGDPIPQIEGVDSSQTVGSKK